MAPLSASAVELPYLFQRLDHPGYRRSFDALFRGEQNLAPWLRAYLKTRDGVDTPGQTVSVGNKPYELYDVCQPHNCAGNDLYVLFTPGGGKAWALFTAEGRNDRLFGHPGSAEQTLLRAAAKR